MRKIEKGGRRKSQGARHNEKRMRFMVQGSASGILGLRYLVFLALNFREQTLGLEPCALSRY